MNKVASAFAALKATLPGYYYGPTNAEDDVDSKLNVDANTVVPHFNPGSAGINLPASLANEHFRSRNATQAWMPALPGYRGDSSAQPIDEGRSTVS